MIEKFKLLFITYKIKILFYSIILLSGLFAVFYIKDILNNIKLQKQEEQIQLLDTQLKVLKEEKNKKDREAVKAVIAFQEQKSRADRAEAKLANLKPINIPNVPPECEEAVESVKVQYDARETIFQEVIIEQKETIQLAEVSIIKLQEEIKIDNTIIKTHEDKDIITGKEIISLKETVKTETQRKKIYRTTSGGLLLVVIILCL